MSLTCNENSAFLKKDMHTTPNMAYPTMMLPNMADFRET